MVTEGLTLYDVLLAYPPKHPGWRLSLTYALLRPPERSPRCGRVNFWLAADLTGVPLPRYAEKLAIERLSWQDPRRDHAKRQDSLARRAHGQARNFVPPLNIRIHKQAAALSTRSKTIWLTATGQRHQIVGIN